MQKVIFHMIIEEELLGRMRVFAVEKEVNVSQYIREVVRDFIRNNDGLPLRIRNQESKRYRVFNNRDFNLCMDYTLYRVIKKFHHQYNFYSMGLSIRDVLWYYVYLIDKYGAEEGMRIFYGKEKVRVKSCCDWINANMILIHMNRNYYFNRLSIAIFVLLLE